MSRIDPPNTRLLIDGRRGDAADGRRFTTVNPADGAPIAEVAPGGEDDVDTAVKAARRALGTGPRATMTGAGRGRILDRLAAISRERMDEIVSLESLDAGKPFAATERQDIAAAIDTIEHFAGRADKLAGEVVPVRNDAPTFSRRSPVGVVAVVVPWDFPPMNAVWKTAPALARGCTVVLKPARFTPLSALRLGAAALDAGLPPGVLNVVPGAGAVAGAASAVWTRDIDRAHRVSGRLHSGMVWVNTHGRTDARSPRGGSGGASGIGRDLGRAALGAYTERRAVWMQFGTAPHPI